MDMDTANKFYRLIKNGMTLKDIENKLGIKEVEVMGMIELCNIYGKQIELVVDNNECCVVKKSSVKKTSKELKPSLDELIHTKLCIVSDTHLGNNRQQLHLLNKVYEEAYKREIDTVLHCGDLVDGDYTSVRKEQKRLNFLLGFDQQCGYVVDMYPSVNGITTKFILGSHDETHFKNGGATIEKWLPKCRK
ncbi:MAG: metallophosphoesterase, partial [Bacilli bacterium]